MIRNMWSWPKNVMTGKRPKVNFYYVPPLVLFVCYDIIACWTHPRSGKSSGATDAAIVAAHMMLEAPSLYLGGHRKLLSETCFYNGVPEPYR